MNIIMIIISFLMIFSLVRMAIGPTVWDRLLGLNLLSSKITMVIVIFAVLQKQRYLLDIALTYALLSIIGLIFICRFIYQKGKI